MKKRPLRRGSYTKPNNKKFDGLITQVGISSKEFWLWFDLMPKSIRDEINAAWASHEQVKELWALALMMHGKEIRAVVAQSGRATDL